MSVTLFLVEEQEANSNSIPVRRKKFFMDFLDRKIKLIRMFG